MSRDLDGVIAAIAEYEVEVQSRYPGALSDREYMRNVGRHDAIKVIRDRVLAIKKRGGGDDEGAERSARRERRGVSTEADDWGPTPGDVVELDPFRSGGPPATG